MQNFKALGDVKVKDLIMTPQLVLIHADSNGENKKYLGLEDVKQYIDIKAVYIKEGDENDSKDFPVVSCEQ